MIDVRFEMALSTVSLLKLSVPVSCFSLSSSAFWKIFRETASGLYGVSLKMYPLLAGNRNEAIRYNYSPSRHLSLSVFNLDPHTLHLEIGHQTLERQACKVKIYGAPATRGFVKGPSHDFLSQACCTGISTLTFSFLY